MTEAAPAQSPPSSPAGRPEAAGLAAVMADGSSPLTRAELERRSRALAAVLRGRGLAPGERVAVLLENTVDWFVVMWAVRRAGLMLVPVNWHLRRDEVRYVLEDSDARALVTSDALSELAAEAAGGLGAIEVRLTTGATRSGFTALAAAEAAAPAPPAGEEIDGGVMLYSSGTSGRRASCGRSRRPRPGERPTARRRCWPRSTGWTRAPSTCARRRSTTPPPWAGPPRCCGRAEPWC